MGERQKAESGAGRHRAQRRPDSCSRKHSRWLICERCAGSYGWAGLPGKRRATRLTPPGSSEEGSPIRAWFGMPKPTDPTESEADR